MNARHKTVVAGSDLELLEDASDDGSGGGAVVAQVVVDDHRRVELAPNHRCEERVKVRLSRRRPVLHRDPRVNQTWILLLHILHNTSQSFAFFQLNLFLLRVDIEILELAVIVLGTIITEPEELLFVPSHRSGGHVLEVRVLPNLIWRSGAHRLSINVTAGLLSRVDPDDLPVHGIAVSAHLFDDRIKPVQGWLSTGKHPI